MISQSIDRACYNLRAFGFEINWFVGSLDIDPTPYEKFPSEWLNLAARIRVEMRCKSECGGSIEASKEFNTMMLERARMPTEIVISGIMDCWYSIGSVLISGEHEISTLIKSPEIG